MIVKTTKGKLFLDWLTWLNPIIPLEDNERRVLAGHLALHYQYTLLEYNPDTLNYLLFSDKVQEDMQKRLNFTPLEYKLAVAKLNKKGLLQEKQINPKLTTYPRDHKFELNVKFEIEDIR